VSDPELLTLLRARRPKHIVIAVGGRRAGAAWGVPAGAISIMRRRSIASGRPLVSSAAQVRIPMWADRWKLGWFFRCLSSPRTFVPRYWHARKLVPLMLKYGERDAGCAGE